jgi:hypothetical protein
MCDHSQLRGKALHVFLFFLKERKRDQCGERRVNVPCLLELSVQPGCDIFPQRPAIGFYDHAAAHWGVICQVGFQNELVVPFCKIFRTGG